MTDLVTGWLIANLPPQAGPVLLSIGSNYDTERPLLVGMFGLVLFVEGWVIYRIYRFLR